MTYATDDFLCSVENDCVMSLFEEKIEILPLFLKQNNECQFRNIIFAIIIKLFLCVIVLLVPSRSRHWSLVLPLFATYGEIPGSGMYANATAI
jgi:uncharacterized ion transporter superfamily protein YfcC